MLVFRKDRYTRSFLGLICAGRQRGDAGKIFRKGWIKGSFRGGRVCVGMIRERLYFSNTRHDEWKVNVRVINKRLKDSRIWGGSRGNGGSWD
jgi:hypothetical protein